MHSSSDSLDSFLPLEVSSNLIEVDVNRSPRLTWTAEMTTKLIEALESECHVLWDTQVELCKDKSARQSKMEYLAGMFGTTTVEISRKIQNLRSRYNHEVRKMEKRQEAGLESATSDWEYFEAMSFIKSSISANDSLTSLDMSLEVDAVNIELAEFQAKEEEVFAAARRLPAQDSSTSDSSGSKKPTLRVAASAPLRPPRSLPNMWTEQPRIQPGLNADECQIFGDFVASELRTLRSEARKRLRRMIQKAILHVGDEEDINNYSNF